MHSVLVKWLFPAIFVGVVVFLIVFLVQINQTDASIYDEKADIPQAQPIPQLPSKEQWIERFSEREDEGYFYPVTEIFVEVDLKDPPKKTTTYQLKAGDLDAYQIYCLKEILKHYQLKYVFEQNKNEANLRIFSNDLKPLKKIVKSLKDYAINARIVKIVR